MKYLWIAALTLLALTSFADAWTWAANPPEIRVADYGWAARTFYETPWVVFAVKAVGVAIYALLILGARWLGRGAALLRERVAMGSLNLMLVGMLVWTSYQFMLGVQSNIAA